MYMLERNLPAMPLIVKAIAADWHFTVKIFCLIVVTVTCHNDRFFKYSVHNLKIPFYFVSIVKYLQNNTNLI